MAHSLSRRLTQLTLTPSYSRALSTSLARSQSVVAEASTSSSSSESATLPQWTAHTKRTGVLARKKGMTTLWGTDGVRYPVTVLHLDEAQVISSQITPSTPTSPARHLVIVGVSPRKEKNTHNALLGQFKKSGVEPKMKLAEFEVTEDAVVKPGETLSALHFVPGQYVDVQSRTIGKGFQGPMKRHGFKGLRASHGVSVSHRSHGSTGQHQDPGRVFPGKKMAGRMGGQLRTTQNLLVHRIDTAQNVLYIRGCVPGAPGAFVRVTDALKKMGWRAQNFERKGLNVEGEVLPGLRGLPMPVGSDEMAKGLPREVEAVIQKATVKGKK